MQRCDIWYAHQPREYGSLRARVNADVAVVGGGLTGLTTALWLARAGLRVTVLEAERLGGGATSRCAGIAGLWGDAGYAAVRRAYGREAACQCAEARKHALKSLRELAQDGCQWRECSFHLTGQTPQDAAALEREARAMDDAGLPASVGDLCGAPVKAARAITLPAMGLVNPMRLLRRVERLAVERGVRVYERSRVVAMETNLAATERGSVRAPYLVVATGYPIVNTPGWYFLRMTQRQAWLARLTGEAAFEDAYLDLGGRYALRASQAGALMTLMGADAGEKDNDGLLARLLERYAPGRSAREAAPGLLAHTADGLPYIGPYGKKTPNLFIAAGFGASGLVGAMTAAQVISARVLGLPWDGYEVFDAGRHGAGDLSATLRMAGRLLGGQLARPSAPRCAHMGCHMRYDRAQRLWVCPCHGSCFDGVGRVLNAPAAHDAVIHAAKRR